MRFVILMSCVLFSTLAMAEAPSVDSSLSTVEVAAPTDFDRFAIRYEVSSGVIYNDVAINGEYRFSERVGVAAGVTGFLMILPPRGGVDLVLPEVEVFALHGERGHYFETGFSAPTMGLTFAYRYESRKRPTMFRAGIETGFFVVPALMVGFGHRF